MALSSFEKFIIQCCKAEEGQFRKWMRRVLPRYDFAITEDDYISDRAEKIPSFKNVHNLLAVRGKPKVCLVAHTDICRDHDSKPPYYGDPNKKPDNAIMVDPIVKTVEVEEEDSKVIKRIIQDRTCATQVGGDDRLGAAINLWVALNTGYDMALLFTTDEEIGCKSANKVKFPELLTYDLCVQVDRGNHSHELVNRINGTPLCSYDTTIRLLEIAFDMGRPRKVIEGNSTDVRVLKSRGIIKEAVNMTCGYHCSFSSGPNEYICVAEAIDTMKYCSSIIRSYNLHG